MRLRGTELFIVVLGQSFVACAQSDREEGGGSRLVLVPLSRRLERVVTRSNRLLSMAARGQQEEEWEKEEKKTGWWEAGRGQ